MTASLLELSIALTKNVLNRPLVEGRIAPEGIRLVPTTIFPSEMYWRQLRFADFDISEMSLSSLFIAVSRGDTRWVALPIFTMRRFFHTDILVRTDSAIELPSNLRGKRIGVPEYQQTSAIWCRGILQHEFGVRPHDIDWFMERSPEMSHGGATGFKPPQGIRLTQISSATNIGDMLMRGELDATLIYLNDANLVDRSQADLNGNEKIRRLFANQLAESQRYFAKTGIYPINHTVVVRSSLLQRHPWIALNLYSAFLAARNEVERLTQLVLQPLIETGQIDQAIKSSFTPGPMPFGFKAAERVLNTIAQYVFEQGLSERVVDPKEVFATATHDI